MQGCVAFKVSFQHLIQENSFTNQILQTAKSIVFARYVENSLILVVAQFEVLSTHFELLFQHWQVILLQRVEQWQGAVVVWSIGSRIDFINNVQLLVHANDMLNCAAFVILHASSFVILVGTHEPSKNLFVAIPCTSKK